eukprot:CAMPEP_0196589066 /NCGR_PEP_ID=MMETSP1081-20130531/62604_1 /TAXON_ID=36882 /ORGANISM="Pyramimonas amylifera, Strain CCMP720" /LENGTH=286 /DNA_ID=CAMNT_0041911777 /DNA_START=312 /DNA_END=1173 /DNA_ORIENTATION=+
MPVQFTNETTDEFPGEHLDTTSGTPLMPLPDSERHRTANHRYSKGGEDKYPVQPAHNQPPEGPQDPDHVLTPFMLAQRVAALSGAMRREGPRHTATDAPQIPLPYAVGGPASQVVSDPELNNSFDSSDAMYTAAVDFGTSPFELSDFNPANHSISKPTSRKIITRNSSSVNGDHRAIMHQSLSDTNGISHIVPTKPGGKKLAKHKSLGCSHAVHKSMIHQTNSLTSPHTPNFCQMPNCSARMSCAAHSQENIGSKKNTKLGSKKTILGPSIFPSGRPTKHKTGAKA